MKIDILHRYNETHVIFSHDVPNNTFRKTVLAAIAAGTSLSFANLSGADLSGANLRVANLREADLRVADLSGANLSGADLSGADLSGANLRVANLSGANLSGADLSGADLSGANLSGANLSGADLSGADLSGADLSGADLSGADLSGANLSGADLSGANLSGANLSGADLSGANLTTVRNDFWAVLSMAPKEVPALIDALKEGRINGSVYEGECACLIGTIANVRGHDYRQLGTMLEPDSSRPAEVWFLGIHTGDTPEKNQQAAIALEWAEQWYASIYGAFRTVVL